MTGFIYLLNILMQYLVINFVDSYLWNLLIAKNMMMRFLYLQYDAIKSFILKVLF